MVCIEKCLHFKRKCRHHPHPILDILPVYLTRGISIAGGLLFRTSPFLRWEKLRCTQQAKAHNKEPDAQLFIRYPVLCLYLLKHNRRLHDRTRNAHDRKCSIYFFCFLICDKIPCACEKKHNHADHKWNIFHPIHALL